TLRKERDPSGLERWVITEHKGDLHPQVVVQDERGQSLAFYYVPEKAHLEVREGSTVSAGTLLAKTPREVGGTQDITGVCPGSPKSSKRAGRASLPSWPRSPAR